MVIIRMVTLGVSAPITIGTTNPAKDANAILSPCRLPTKSGAISKKEKVKPPTQATITIKII